MRDLPARLLAILVELDGVVTHRQCLDAGLPWTRFGTGWRRRSWQRLDRGIYYTQAGEVPLRSRARGALVGSSGRAVLSQLTAGHIHRFDGLLPAARVDVTVPPNGPRRSSRLVSAHRGRLDATEWSYVAGLPVMSAARTCLDLARRQPRLIAVRAVESALRQQQLDRAQLVTLATKARGWPGGRRNGLTPHTARAAFRHDRRRQNALMNRGWLVLRFTWEDVFARPAYVVQEVRTALGDRIGVSFRAVVGAA